MTRTSIGTSAFEQRLLDELKLVAAERSDILGAVDVIPPPVARRYRVPLAVGAVAAVTAGLVAFPVLGGGSGGGSSAYALSRSSDGTITVRLHNPKGLPGLERELRGLGVRVKLMEKTPPDRCHTLPTGRPTLPDEEHELLGWDGRDAVLKINEKTLPPGHTLLLEMPGVGEPATGMGFGEVAEVPACIPDYSVGAHPPGPSPVTR